MKQKVSRVTVGIPVLTDGEDVNHVRHSALEKAAGKPATFAVREYRKDSPFALRIRRFGPREIHLEAMRGADALETIRLRSAVLKHNGPDAAVVEGTDVATGHEVMLVVGRSAASIAPYLNRIARGPAPY